MNKFSKLLVSLAGFAMAVAVFAVPAKAGTLEQDQAWVQAQALAGMVSGQAHLDNIAAQAAAGMASGQAYLNAAKATMDKDQASLAAAAAAGMVSGQAHLDEIAAQAKAGMVASATEAVRVAKANLSSVKELAKVNPSFEAQIPACEAALAKAEAELAALK